MTLGDDAADQAPWRGRHAQQLPPGSGGCAGAVKADSCSPGARRLAKHRASVTIVPRPAVRTESDCHPDQALVVAALARQPAAVSELVRRLTPAIQRSVTRLLYRAGTEKQGNIPQEVEDLVQEVFVALFAKSGQTLRRWTPTDSGSLEGFIGMVAQRAVITILRSRRQSPFQLRPQAPEDFARKPANGAQPEERVAAKDSLVRIAHHLREKLSPEGLQMFYGLFVWEDSIADLSARTGLKPEAIYQWRSRLKRQVLALCEEEEVR